MMPRPGLFRRVLRALLAMYPRRFRGDFGADLADTHVDRYRSARRRGRVAAFRYALTAFADVCWGAMHEWRDVSRRRRQPRLPRALPVFDARQSLRAARRSLKRRPALAASVIVTLALGIGATTAVFSLVDAVLLRPLPAVADPRSVVAVYALANPDAPRDGVPFPTFQALKSESRTLEALAAYADHDVALQVPGRSALVSVTVVSGGYFSVLGVQPQLGRLIGASDDTAPFASPVVVLSDGVWTREFSRRADVLGQSIQLGPTAFTVIGIAPPAFRGAHLSRSPDFWVPLTMIQGLDLGGMLSGRFSRTLFTTFRGYGWLQLVGRLNPGVSPAGAATALTQVLGAARAASSPARPAARAEVVPINAAAALADRAATIRFVSLLIAVVVLILLLACLNVATLLLVRAAERAREIGVCAALGASRARIASALLVESLLLALAGGMSGVGVGLAAMRLFGAFSLPGDIPIAGLGLGLDSRVLGFACLLTLATTLLFGLAPALRASRTEPAQAFRLNVRASSGSGPRPELLAAQIAISLVILVTAGLFIRSLRAGLSTDLGFDPRPIAAATVELRLHGYTSARAAEFYGRIVERLGEIPGVDRAAVASDVPLAPGLTLGVRPTGAPDSAPALRVGRNFVTPGYFRTIGVPLLSGRDFAATDTPRAPLVVLVNESAARALWPDGQAIGRRIVDVTERTYSVIGVVRDTKYESLSDVDRPFIFFSILQEPVTGTVDVLARVSGSPDPTGALRGAIAGIDSIVAPVNFRRLDDQVRALLMPQRFGSMLLAMLGGIAVIIAAVGIYATLAYAVAQRRSELGIRIALGAARGNVLRAVLGRTAATIGLGVLAGLAVSAAAARGVAHFLYGIETLDVAAFAGSTIIVASILGVASAIPARRACRVDPVQTLRGD